MIIIECEQGTPQWHQARLGIPTASRFGEVMTPKTRKVSAQAKGYRRQLVAERLIGEPCETFEGSAWTQRGTELEPRAREWYAWERDTAVIQVGFCRRDDGLAGCSPDFLVGDDGLGELKCPSAKVHVGYLLESGSLSSKYEYQTQGGLFVTGRAWCDVVSFCPGLPTVVERVAPDLDYHADLESALRAFVADVDADEAAVRVLMERADEPNAVRCPISGEPMGDF